jgi:hypothetical protein
MSNKLPDTPKAIGSGLSDMNKRIWLVIQLPLYDYLMFDFTRSYPLMVCRIRKEEKWEEKE